jgi:hypothetical protein
MLRSSTRDPNLTYALSDPKSHTTIGECWPRGMASPLSDSPDMIC